MNIASTVKKHDNFQLEFKTVYPIDPDLSVSEYNADVFFFLPRNLAVNEYTFPSSKFYDDFSEYFRFKTPAFSLNVLVKKDNPVIMRLSEAMNDIEKDSKNFNQCLKMFCSIVKSALRDSADEVKTSADAATELRSYLEDSGKVLNIYRNLRTKVMSDSHALELFDLVDEFLSLSANRYRYDLWKFFSKEYPDDKLSIKAIAESTYHEISHRRTAKYCSLPDTGGDNSELLYRESALKKALANVLFLNVETRKDGIMIENILMAFAAAVAMIFVTAIAFLWQGLALAEFSFSFFAVWVIAYMFKDRIKSQLQLYFLAKRSRYSYDFKQKIHDAFGNDIGVFHEGFRYCNGKDIDENIRKVRNRTIVSRLLNGSLEENVLVYRKKIELKKDACKDIFRDFNVDGVVNIYRLSVRHWLNKMDNPERQIYYSDGENIHPLTANRDYHVNIIMRIGGKNCQEQYVRYRLVLCRNGIRKLIKFD